MIDLDKDASKEDEEDKQAEDASYSQASVSLGLIIVWPHEREEQNLTKVVAKIQLNSTSDDIDLSFQPPQSPPWKGWFTQKGAFLILLLDQFFFPPDDVISVLKPR